MNLSARFLPRPPSLPPPVLPQNAQKHKKDFRNYFVLLCLFVAKFGMPDFIPGLQLSELFYREAAKPILDAYFPQVSYSAGLLGWGSEGFGYEQVSSSAHYCG